MCGREYALRWCVAGNVFTVRRHGRPDICDGSGCGPAEDTVREVRRGAVVPRLRWIELPYPHTDDGRFALQREHLLHEGVFYSLECERAEDRALLHSERARHIENGWYGRGAKAKAKRAAQQLADLAATI